MKHIINYLSALLAVVLIGGTFASCAEDDDNGSAHPGLGIKVFFPTKVVANQPMTINGSGFNDVTEVEFPGGVTVTNLEIIGEDMIKLNAPAGIAEEGGKIIVRSASGQAESRLPLTLGHTNVSGFSVQPGDAVTGGDQITVFGTDLEFINSVELLDADSVSQIIDHKDFYRKGTSNLIFTLPKKNIFEGSWVGKLHTFDGKTFDMPELAYAPAKDEGHYETVKTVIWKNDGSLGGINWGGDYRFAPESNSTGEECYTVPQDVWEKMKTQVFYATIKGDNPQVRITTGWWTTNLTENDIQPGNELLADNGDGTWTLTIDLSSAPALLELLDAQHLLFTGGNGFTVEELYFAEEVWVDGPGMKEVKESVWKNDGSLGNINWSGDYRFAPESNSTGEECYTVPQDIWERLKSETFYITVKGDNPQVRITTGWWTTNLTENDIQPGNELMVDNGDGTWTVTVNLASNAGLLELLDAQHLLFTGSGYSVEEIYFIKLVDGSTPSEYDIAPWCMYQDRSDFVSWPFYPSWSDDKGKWRIMRGVGDPTIESLSLSTSSKFVVYKEVGTTGQIQWNDPNWGTFSGVECNDWDGSAETIEVPITEDMLKCINGEVSDGWSDTAIILQGDGLTVTKIVLVP